MARYIVRRSSGSIRRSLKLMARRVHVGARQAQTAELAAAAQRDLAKLRSVLVDERIRVCGYGRVTGVAVAEMSPRTAEVLRERDPDLQVLEDVPLELVGPETVAALEGRAAALDTWHLDAIGLTAAREAGYAGDGRGVTVAVLDTGVEAHHPELRGKVLGAYRFDAAQWRCSEQRPSLDTGGHGTYVAGLICGDNVGVAPGARIMSGVMTRWGYGHTSDFVLAVEWVASRPEVAVAIMSGIRVHESILSEAVDTLVAAGVLPLIASGAEVLGGARSSDARPHRLHDLGAPGVGVTSCVSGGGYEARSGASVAPAVFAGMAALLVERYPRITVDELEETLPHACAELRIPVTRPDHGLVRASAG